MTTEPTKPADEPKKTIGVATMSEDGTITLMLVAEGPGGIFGDALLTYKKSDPRYADILKHLGGLTVGEEKHVPPWT